MIEDVLHKCAMMIDEGCEDIVEGCKEAERGGKRKIK
jgi:hypothetical protein